MNQGSGPTDSGNASSKCASGRASSGTLLPLYLTAIVIVLSLTLGLGGWRYQRVRANQVWLEQCQAEYQWYCQLPAFRFHAWPRIQNAIGSVMGVAAVSDIFSVNLRGELPDQSLERLRYLRHLDQLELASPAATDKTLGRIAQLRQLRCLSLAGQQFTFEGLLELRRLPNLRELVLSEMPLSMAELAVLETAVPQANLTYNRNASSVTYQRKVAARFPSQYRPKQNIKVGFEPLLGTSPKAQDPTDLTHGQRPTLSDI